jgi:hypothetical protein
MQVVLEVRPDQIFLPVAAAVLEQAKRVLMVEQVAAMEEMAHLLP